MLKRRGRCSAMVWRWETVDDTNAEPPGNELELGSVEQNQGVNNGNVAAETAEFPTAALGWGPGMLWIPTAQQLAGGEAGATRDLWPSVVDDLGVWAAGYNNNCVGSEWKWASDGTRVDGWIRLLPQRRLASKWGSGSWILLSATDAQP